jgi:hypothetical protein
VVDLAVDDGLRPVWRARVKRFVQSNPAGEHLLSSAVEMDGEFLGPSGRASKPISARTLAGRGFSRQRREGCRQNPLISQLHLDATVERAATVGVVVGERFE